MSLFKGTGVAIVTPFNNDGQIDWPVLEQLIERQIDAGIEALIFCGTTGESPTLSPEEHEAVIRFGIEKTNGRTQVIAGTGSNNTFEAITYSKHAEEAGADGLLLITPYYNKPTQRGLIAHFEAIANEVNIPIILYNVPGRTAVNLLPSSVLTLAEHPNIAAIKEASGDISQVAEIAANKPEDFLIYSGNDDQVIPVMSLGGSGVISVTANIAPKETKAAVDAYLSGDIETATKLTLEMRNLHMVMFVETNPAPVKAALELMGYPVGSCRLPLVPMTEGNIETVKNEMKAFGLNV